MVLRIAIRVSSRALTRLRAGAQRQDGYSMAEVLAVMFMLGIGFTAALLFYHAAVDRTADTEARKDALEEERVAMERMARDIREAETVTISTEEVGGESTTAGNVITVEAPHGTVAYDCSAGACVPTGDGGPLIDDLDLDEWVFSIGSPFDDSDTSTVNIRLSQTPEGRDGKVTLERTVTARSACDPGLGALLPGCS